MVDCFDRIAVQMTELALEPVRLLAERPMLGAVSIRTPSGGNRFLVTIAKRFPHGENAPPAYTWEVAEVDAAGEPQEAAVRANADATYDDPVTAYWAAVNGLCAI